jgi:hypothetical protein
MPRKRRPEVESAARPSGETLAVGRIIRPHGVRGGLLLEAYSELVSVLVPDAQVFVGEARQPATVIGVRKHGERYLLELKGARAWRPPRHVCRGVAETPRRFPPARTSTGRSSV